MGILRRLCISALLYTAAVNGGTVGNGNAKARAKRSASVTPPSPSSFEADSSINVAGIYAAAVASAQKRSDVLASYAAEQGDPINVDILGDWLGLQGAPSAYHWLADMDVDCDGVDYMCPNNPDGQDETNFGELDARQVPWYVIPNTFYVQQGIQPNALGAVICNGKMYYGIFGDSNGDTPEVIGEASLLMAQTCFPGDGLDGGTGHVPLDVVYICFPTEVPSGVGDVTIDIGALKTLGDQQVTLLQQALGLGSAGSSPAPSSSTKSSGHSTSRSHSSTQASAPTQTPPPPPPSGGGESGDGSDQCEGDDDCDGTEVCCVFALIGNICIAQNTCSNSQCSASGMIGSCDGG